MKYQLRNGRTVFIPDEQYFNMSDLDFKDLEGSSYGYEIDDPFYDSVLDDGMLITYNVVDIEEIVEIEPDSTEEEE